MFESIFVIYHNMSALIGFGLDLIFYWNLFSGFN